MSPRRKGCGGCLLRLLAVAVVLAIAAGAVLYYGLFQPYKGFQNETFVEIPKGTSSRAIADQLVKAGVIRGAWQFALARILRPGDYLQAGEYRFTAPASAITVYDRIAKGDIYFNELKIPEGANMFDIAAAVERLGYGQAADFLTIAKNPAMIHDLAPDAPTLEGYLFPSTYRLTRHTTPEQICKLMTDTFRKKWQQLEKPQQIDSINAAVTLASLIEKETGVPAERPTVASVYVNRLKNRMALDCDPTTIYAALLEHRYRGTIYRSDLESASPYNTYHHPGLPPGPIANPGIASLKAALAPADTGYLYFVARGDGSGGHHFATTIEEHERNVQQYRHTQK